MDGDGRMTLYTTVLGREIRCDATRLDEGIHVLLTGGHKSHIGAVSVCDPGKEPETMTMPGHKEQYVTAPWSKAISNAANARCCVVCGIHYDNATPQELAAIMDAVGQLLNQLIAALDPQE